jgi:hypothetical protein
MKTPQSRTTFATAAAACALLAAAGTLHAQCAPDGLSAGDRQSNWGFASSMALSPTPIGLQLAVGAPLANYNATDNCGSVYIFGLNGTHFWQIDQVWANFPDRLAGSQFGRSIGYSYPYMVVGAPAASTGAGKAIFFEHTNLGWTQKDTFVGPAQWTFNGDAVAISDQYAVVGAPFADVSDPNSVIQTQGGFADIYQRQANGHWSPITRIQDLARSDAYAYQHLGSAVAISGNVAVVGAPDAANTANQGGAGCIKILRKNAANSWIAETGAERLFAPDSYYLEGFGTSLATDGTFIVVGAPLHDSTPAEGGAKTDAGKAYVYAYVNGAWQLDGQLLASEAAANDKFGTAVSIANYRILVSSGGGTINSGHKAYVFKRTDAGWTQESVLHTPDIIYQNFGSSVATDGSHFIVGDDKEYIFGLTDAGAAYDFAPGTASDSCDGATRVFPSPANSTVLTGCTASASPSNPQILGCGGATAGNDVWYSFTPTCSGNMVIDTFGSAFDTILSVHDDCPTPGNEHIVGCNDDGFALPNRASLVNLNYVAGQTYLVRVTGYNNAQGDYTIRFNDFSPTPANNEAPGAIAITVGTTTFDTCTATTNGVTDCNRTFGKDVWFKYTAACTGLTTIDTCGSDFDTVLAVYLGLGTPNAPDTSIACNDDNQNDQGCLYQSKVSFSTVQGFQYLVRVGGFTGFNGTSSGHGTLHIGCAMPICPCDWNHSGTVSVQDIFDFLSSYFAGQGDFNNSSQTTVQDIFDFLACYFAGCP